MKLSFVIPAFNEASYIESCLANIDAAVAGCRDGGAYEVTVECIVVDNNSTDATATLAEQAGAKVVFEPVNQISRARNAGAGAATGDWLIFVDADSHVSVELLLDVLRLIEGGAHVGCGAVMEMQNVPLMWRWSLSTWRFISKAFSWAAGSFVVCRADVFAELDGFSEQLYVSEEIEFSRRIKKLAKRQGKKFTVLPEHPLITSGRKLELYSNRELVMQTLRLILGPRRTPKNKAALDVWYDGRR